MRHPQGVKANFPDKARYEKVRMDTLEPSKRPVSCWFPFSKRPCPEEKCPTRRHQQQQTASGWCKIWFKRRLYKGSIIITSGLSIFKIKPMGGPRRRDPGVSVRDKNDVHLPQLQGPAPMAPAPWHLMHVAQAFSARTGGPTWAHQKVPTTFWKNR